MVPMLMRITDRDSEPTTKQNKNKSSITAAQEALVHPIAHTLARHSTKGLRSTPDRTVQYIHEAFDGKETTARTVIP